MARKKKAKTNWGCVLQLLIFCIIINNISTLHRQHIATFILLFLPISAICVLYVWLKLRRRWKSSQQLRLLELEEIDLMSGEAFERYIARLLQGQGYKTTLTKGSGDFGVDIVAQKNDIKCAIQCKRHYDNVSRRAISDVVAGKQYYGCSQAMVVTNSRFTPGARELAKSTQCILVDRDTLAGWIASFQQRERSGTTQQQVPGFGEYTKGQNKSVGTTIVDKILREIEQRRKPT